MEPRKMGWGRFWFLGGLVLGLLAFLGAMVLLPQGERSRSPAASGWTTPAPAFTPAPGGPASVPVLTPPGAEPPAYRITPPVRPGRILHWAFRRRFFDPSAPDPANGREIHGTLTLEVGASGGPVRFHGRFVLDDGRPYAEIWRTPEQGWELRLLDPGGPRCHREPSSPEEMEWTFPLFVDPGQLAAAGWRPVQGETPAVELPMTRGPEGVALERVVGEGTLRYWEWAQSGADGTVERAWMAVGPEGQVRAVIQEVRDREGRRRIYDERAYGALWIAQPDPLWEPMLRPSGTMTTECGGKEGTP
ncbi:MAG TPA: hypothetical protein VNK89_06890 [Thermoflexus sp.]|nr:hypothetical protein [Thermoflexus sp.]